MKEENNQKKSPQAKLASAAGGMITGQGSKISNATLIFMLATAGFFDLLSIIPVVNWFAAIVAWLTFGLWFMILGVGLINPKKVAVWGTSALIGVIPALSAIPELIGAVALTALIVRAEDELGFKLPTPGAHSPVKGGRGQAAKLKRRMSQTPEHRKESVERLRRRFESSKQQRDNQPHRVDGIDFRNAIRGNSI